MNIRVSHTFLQVDDHDAALGFYRDTLGLEVRSDVSFNEFRWLSLGSAEQPGLEIVLESADMGRSPEDAKAINELRAKGSLSGLIFWVEDCDALFEKVRASGAEVVQEPTDQDYGMRDCAFRDPAGNQIRFSGKSAS